MGRVSRCLCAAAIAIAVAPCVVGCTGGTPERPAPGTDYGFKLPYSYENTRCFAACAETIARMKAEEEAKKRAEAEAAKRAAEEAARRASAKRVSTKKTASTGPGEPEITMYPWYCTNCGKRWRQRSYPQRGRENLCSECMASSFPIP